MRRAERGMRLVDRREFVVVVVVVVVVVRPRMGGMFVAGAAVAGEIATMQTLFCRLCRWRVQE